MIRHATYDDIPELIELGRAHVAETVPHLDFYPVTVMEYATIFLNNPDCCLLVYNQDDKPVGYLYGYLAGFLFNKTQKMSAQELWYVRPEYRGRMGGVLLIKEYEKWAREKGAAEIHSGVVTEHVSERVSKLFGHLGFRQTGQYFKKVCV